MWFRRDLRIEDNRALKQALEESDSLILLFHVNPKQFLNSQSKNAAVFFRSVELFKKELEKKGSMLHILYGDLPACFKKLKKEFPDWNHLYMNRDENGYGLERDWLAASILDELDVKVHGFHDHYLHSAQEIKTNAQTSYKVFTPYFNKWIDYPKPSIVEVGFNVKK